MKKKSCYEASGREAFSEKKIKEKKLVDAVARSIDWRTGMAQRIWTIDWRKNEPVNLCPFRKEERELF